VEPLTRGYRPQIPVLPALCPQMNLLHAPPPKKIPGHATGYDSFNETTEKCQQGQNVGWQVYQTSDTLRVCLQHCCLTNFLIMCTNIYLVRVSFL
jgi:hypothetical protein